jgi:hypothetical protein
MNPPFLLSDDKKVSLIAYQVNRFNAQAAWNPLPGGLNFSEDKASGFQ